MTTLRVGIASYEEMKARTMAVARGKLRITRNEPKVWFTSTESFAKVLSAGNRDLLRVIVEQEPGSLDELAGITCKSKGCQLFEQVNCQLSGFLLRWKGPAAPCPLKDDSRPLK